MATTAWSSPKAHQQQSRSFCYQCGLLRTPTPAVGWDEDQEPACAMHMVKADKPLPVSETIDIPPVIAEPIQPTAAPSQVQTKPEVKQMFNDRTCICGCGESFAPTGANQKFAPGHKEKPVEKKKSNLRPMQHSGPPMHVLELRNDELDFAIMRVLRCVSPETKLAVLRSLLVTEPAETSPE